jgi:thiol-disulfide isomerase/thioredoxin
VAGIDALISQIFGPHWKFSDMNNTMHSSSDYYSQNLTLVEFFHTDCSHCQSQVPVLKEFYSNYSSDVSLISIGGYPLGSNNTDTLETIQNFTNEYNASWTYLYDDSHQMMQSFGLNSYPSWVLFDGNQIVSTFGGSQKYSELVDMVENHTAAIVPSVELESILLSLNHWAQFDEKGNRHVSDKDVINSIIAALNYDYEEPKDEFDNYGVSHSSKLYIIDQEGNMRVVWRGYDWTYASVYHDIELLL